jgi:hypothetical protein
LKTNEPKKKDTRSHPLRPELALLHVRNEKKKGANACAPYSYSYSFYCRVDTKLREVLLEARLKKQATLGPRFLFLYLAKWGGIRVFVLRHLGSLLPLALAKQEKKMWRSKGREREKERE